MAGNVVVIADGAIDEAFSDLGYGDIDLLANKDYVRHTTLPDANGKSRDVPLLSWELYQVVNQPLANPRPGGKSRRIMQTRGVEDPPCRARFTSWRCAKPASGSTHGAGVQAVPGGGNEQFVQGVLGEGIARTMGQDAGKATLAVGDTFMLGPRHWVVVGIMNSGGKTFDSEIWAKRKVVGEMLRKDTRSTAVFRVAAARDPAQVADYMTGEFKSPAIVAKTEAAYFDQLNQTNQQFLTAIIIVAALMAVGGMFGVMNTMFAAVPSERARSACSESSASPVGRFWSRSSSKRSCWPCWAGPSGCALGLLCNGLSATSP